MSFFKAFFATCRGPVSFGELRRQAWWRVIIHFFLTLLISCIFVAVGRYCALKYFWSRPEQMFIESFGSGVTISRAGILPEKDADVSRRQELPYEGLLLYVSPKGPEKDYPDETLEKRNFILLWTPGEIGLAVRDHKTNLWRFSSSNAGVSQVLRPEDINMKTVNNLSLAQLKQEMLKLAVQPLPKEFVRIEKSGFVPARDTFKTMRAGMAVFNGGVYFSNAVLLVFFGLVTYMLVFMLIEHFSESDKRITVSDMWKIVLYAACPVIVVVNVFPMLQLPFESLYDKIFLVGWIVYINIIKRCLEKNPALLENPEE